MHSQEKSVQPQKHCSILQRMRQHPLKGRYITMKVTITGKNIEVSEYLRDLALKKIAKLERYFPEDTEVLITMAVEKNRHIVEVTIPYQGGIIRGEESTGDMYASIDNVIAKLEKQIHRHKTRLEKSLRYDDASPEYDDYDDEDEGPHIVRVKRFSMKPMSVEEAMLQLELLGHSFFVFTNAETDRINVIYARKDGNFGLIEPGQISFTPAEHLPCSEGSVSDLTKLNTVRAAERSLYTAFRRLCLFSSDCAPHLTAYNHS